MVTVKTERLYYVDVLRASAIMLVIMAHTIKGYGPTEFTAPLQLGGSGVTLFFVLSGWLIGNQLFKELGRSQTIDLKRFWVRRWMRTIPAYYAVLFATLAQQYFVNNSTVNPLPYLTFTQNYLTDMPYFYVSWSLAVEEQFYLFIAPAILVLSSFKLRVFSIVLLILLLSPTVLRTTGLYESLIQTHVRWDGCLLGVGIAFVGHYYKNLWEKISCFSKLLLGLGIAAYLSFYALRWLGVDGGVYDPPKLVLCLTFGAMMIFCVNHPVKRLPFGHSVIMYISTRSYSLYLLHVEGLMLVKRFLPDYGLVVYAISAFVLSAVLSEVLYRVVEIPFINLREKFAISKSSRH